MLGKITTIYLTNLYKQLFVNQTLLTIINKLGVPYGIRRTVFHFGLDYWPPLRSKIKKRANRIIKKTSINDYLKSGGKYLDIGCGGGYLIKTILEQNLNKKISITAIDNSNYPTRKVRKWFSKYAESNSFFAKADATNLPFKNGQFDGVTIFFVLHHLKQEDQVKALKEVRRVLKKNGYAFVTEDIVDSEKQRAITEQSDIRTNWESSDKPHNYRSREEWIAVFNRLKLKTVAVNSFISYYYHLRIKNAAFILKKI